MSGWKWNGNCGCGKPAQSGTTQSGVKYYSCFFGRMDDAKCSMRYAPDSIESEKVAVGGKVGGS